MACLVNKIEKNEMCAKMDPGLSILALLLLLTLFFILREPNVYKPHGFFFGLPHHFHLLLCNCLVLSLFAFCGK